MRFLMGLMLVAGCADGSGTDSDVGTEADSDMDTVADTDVDTDDDSDSESDTDADTNGVTCDRTGFATDSEGFVHTLSWDHYEAFTAGSPYDGISFDIYYFAGATSGAQTHTFQASDSYASCAYCLQIGAGCTDTSTCEKTFFAQAGQVVLTGAPDADDATFAGTLEDVVLVEVTVDAQTDEASVVPGGETWCLDGYTFSGTTQ